MTDPIMMRCPNGHVGVIDLEQALGEHSVICPECNWHGWATHCPNCEGVGLFGARRCYLCGGTGNIGKEEAAKAI